MNQSVDRSRHFNRWLIGVVAAFALLATACGSSNDSATTVEPSSTTTAAPATTSAPSTDATTTAAPATTAPPTDEPRTASFKGVTEDTIKIAVSYLDFDKLQELDLSPNGWGDQELVYRALIDDINAQGGINGRQIEVVTYESYSPVDPVEADEVCVRMTQDHEVFLVLGGFLGPTDKVNPCIVTLNDTALVGGALKPEAVADATAPWFDFRPEEKSQALALIDLLDQTGRTADADVFILTLTGAEALADDVLEPRLDELGIPVAGTAVLSIPDGDPAAQDDAMQPIIARLQASGANTILLPGGVSAVLRNLLAADIFDEYDIWAFANDHVANMGESVDQTKVGGVITIGRLSATETFDDPLMVQCRAVFTEANPSVDVKSPDEVLEGEDAWYQALGSYCSRVALMKELLTAAGVNPTYDTLQAGADSIGEFSMPGVPNASLAPGKPGADDSFRLSVWDPTAGERGDVVPLTEILDVTP